VSTWVVQARADDTEPWRDDLLTKRFVDAIRRYDDLPEPKRFMRNGRVIRMHVTDEQLDIFQEETP
jgi:hypothetical protein